MCGIGLVAARDDIIGRASQAIADSIENRGPDGSSTHRCDNILYMSSILHIQGDMIVKQPYCDAYGNILLWNGEMFESAEVPDLGTRLNICDTVIVSELLRTALSLIQFNVSADVLREVGMLISSKLSLINGPYAFIYFHQPSRTTTYGRDPFGRRSLLRLRNDSDLFSLCSVWPNPAWCSDTWEV